MKLSEQDLAISGLLKRRTAARRRRADLENELRTAGKFLYDVGGALRFMSGGTSGSRVDYILPKLTAVPAMCDLARVRAMLEELKELDARLNQLNHRASEMGID